MHATAAAAVGATLQPSVRSRRRLFGNVLSQQDVRSAAEAERMRSTSRTAPPGYSPVGGRNGVRNELRLWQDVRRSDDRHGSYVQYGTRERNFGPRAQQ